MSKTHNQATEANLSNYPLAIFIKLKNKVCCQPSTRNHTLNFILNKKYVPQRCQSPNFSFFMQHKHTIYPLWKSTFHLQKRKFNVKISITSSEISYKSCDFFLSHDFDTEPVCGHTNKYRLKI